MFSEKSLEDSGTGFFTQVGGVTLKPIEGDIHPKDVGQEAIESLKQKNAEMLKQKKSQVDQKLQTIREQAQNLKNTSGNESASRAQQIASKFLEKRRAIFEELDKAFLHDPRIVERISYPNLVKRAKVLSPSLTCENPPTSNEIASFKHDYSNNAENDPNMQYIKGIFDYVLNPDEEKKFLRHVRESPPRVL